MPDTTCKSFDDGDDVENDTDININKFDFDFEFDFHEKANDNDFDEDDDDFDEDNFDNDPLHPSFRSTYSNNSCSMPVAKKNLFDNSSPPKARKKLAMVVKKPKSTSPVQHLHQHDSQQQQQLESSISNLEGELTNFLSMNDNVHKTSTQRRQDDGTTSTTSRTTKSSIASRNGNGHGPLDSHNNDNERSLGKSIGDIQNSISNGNDNNNSHSHSALVHKNNSRSYRRQSGSSNHNAWDWSHHSNDWMNLESAGGSDQFTIESALETEGDELTRHLNDSFDGESMNGSIRMNRSSRSTNSSATKQHSSRRIARQQEILNPISSPSARRQGDRKTLRSAQQHANARSRRSKSRDSCSCSCDSDDTPQASVTTRRRSGTKSAHARTMRSKSRDRARQSRSKSRTRRTRDNGRSKSRDRTMDNRSSSPTTASRRRRMSGSHKGPSGSSSHHQRRSRSIDGQSHHSAASESTTGANPYSTNQSRRGRRRTSLNFNTSASANLNASCNLNASATWVDAVPAKQVAEQQRMEKSERGERRGRQGRRSSMTNATLIVEEQRHTRGKSASARTSRRKSTGDESYEESSMNDGSQHKRRDSLSGSRHGPRDALSGSRHGKQHGSSHHNRRRGSGRSKNIDRGEIVPERLSSVLSNHQNNHESSKFEKVAMAIFVAEDGDHDEFEDDDVEFVPPHLLADPSNVPLSLHW